MRALIAVCATVLTMCLAIGFSIPAAGSAATVAPNNGMWADGVFPDFTLDQVYKVSFTWTSDVPLGFSVSGPSGLIHSYPASTSGSGSYKTEDGTLYFVWWNPGSVSATLEYDLTYEYSSEHTASTLLWAVIGAVAIIMVVVVFAVILVVRALGRTRNPFRNEQFSQPPPYVPQGQTVSSMRYCPGCGAEVNPSTRICPGCGARVL
jgi:hypothetical protein